MLLSLRNLSLTTLDQIILTCICANFEYIHSAIITHTTMYVFFFFRFSFLNNFKLLKKVAKIVDMAFYVQVPNSNLPIIIPVSFPFS